MAVSVLSSQGQVQQRLGLTNAPDAQNKSIVLVKLTDSSLEALTNYIKNAASASTKPTINFSNNTGTFTVPIPGEGGNLKLQKFNFSLSSNQESGPQASFECLESRRPDTLESLGPVKHKAQVQASERSFEKFREQIGDVKREQEKRTTRILDKSKIGGVSSAAGLVSGKRIVSRKHILANKSLQSAGRSNDLNKYSHTHGHGSRSHSQQPKPPPLIKNGCHPMLDRNKHKNKPNYNPEIMKRTLRERIVHLLAVRPLKKPELMDRIDVRDKEKKDLFPLVKQVSIMKDNTYHLRKDVWNDVSEDWPFYTEEERQAFLRQKPQNLTPPGSDGGSSGSVVSGHSSSSSHPSSPQQVLKRSSAYPTQGSGSSPLSDNLEKSTSPAAKKKRVSNFMKPTNSLSPMSSLGRSPNNRSPSAPVLPPAAPEESFESKTNAWLRGSMESPERPLTRAQLKTNHQDVDKFSPSRKTVGTDFTLKFVRIGCREQRQAYKAEFDKDYSRYKILHSELDRVSQRFANLQQQLRHTPEASPDHQRLKKMIVKEYQSANDSQIKRDREEFHYLHKKLEHIKKLVHDYDTEHPKQRPGQLIK